MSCKYVTDSHKSIFRSQYIAVRSDVIRTDYGYVDSIHLVKCAFPSKFFLGNQPKSMIETCHTNPGFVIRLPTRMESIQSDHFLICVACVRSKSCWKPETGYESEFTFSPIEKDLFDRSQIPDSRFQIPDSRSQILEQSHRDSGDKNGLSFHGTKISCSVFSLQSSAANRVYQCLP